MNLRCKLCKSSKVKIVNCIHRFNLHRCVNCDVSFIFPQPSQDSIDKYNKSQYETNNSEIAYFNKRQELITRAEKCGEILSKYKTTGNLLDVGCSYGFYLQVFKQKGYNAVGIDTSKKALDYAKRQLKLKVLESSFETYHFNPKSWDIITLFDVLEHFPNPKMIIEKIHSTLKENGIVVIQTPNFKSIMSILTGWNWFWLLIPQHLFLYSAKSLKLLLETNKFRVLEINTWDDIKEFTDNILMNIRIRKDGKMRFFYIIFSKILMRVLPFLTFLWNKKYLGGEIIIYAQKIN